MIGDMRTVAITQARTGSTRLPGKVLMKVNGITLLEIHIKRILKSKSISELIVATTLDEADLAIVDIATLLGVACYRGSTDDVLDRFYQSLKGRVSDYVVRLTADCPLIDAELIDKVIKYTIDRGLDYCSNALDPKYPDGQDIEVFKFEALVKAWHEARHSYQREHVTPYLWENSTYKGGSMFKSENFQEEYSYGHLRMTVDEPRDFDVIKKLISDEGVDKSWLDYARYLEKNQDVKALNETIERNEGYRKSIKKEK